jgi:hypothetical protein
MPNFNLECSQVAAREKVIVFDDVISSERIDVNNLTSDHDLIAM